MRYDGFFRVAHETKQPFHAVMGWPGPPTARQLTVWRAWLDAEWDRPSRADWYAMGVTKAVIQGAYLQMGASPDQIREANFKLAFTPEAQAPVSAEDAEAQEEEYQRHVMEISKAQALARRGARTVVEVPMPLAREEVVEEQPDLTVDDATYAAMAARINADAEEKT